MRPVPDAELRAALETALGVRRFVDQVAADAPFRSLAALLASASASAAHLSEAEIDEAMAHHPRIGERPVGTGASQSFSAAEQASADADDVVLAAAIAEGNRLYEARFGRVFLIRAAGRTRAQILAALRGRLTLDPDLELRVVAAQLRQIALIRIESTFRTEAPA